jgi:DNA-binding SARP family transcriptional activator/Tfp pilus assembly protein PilF
LQHSLSNKPTLHAEFFGSFSISINSCPIVEISSLKARGLFAYLILENHQAHSRSTLASLFWPDVPEQTALHNLRQALTTIKKAISVSIDGLELFSGERESLRINDDVDIQVDILEFEKRIQVLLDHHDGRSACGFPIHQLKATMSCAAGEILPLLTLPDTDLFEDWLTLRKERINRFRVSGYSVLLKYYESRGEWIQARKTAEAMLAIAPWDEDIHARLIQILLQSSLANVALTHYHSAVRYLKSSLDIEPGLVLQNAHADIQRFLSSGKIHTQRISQIINLPGYATPFVGRDNEIMALENWISNPDYKVITITGPGGSGKTRLAVELARLQNTFFKDGIYFISVAGCFTIEEMTSTILGALGDGVEHKSNSMEELLTWAHYRCALMILDNVEDVQTAALLVKELTEAAPNIVLLLTAYSFLNLMGEKVYALNGLSTLKGDKSDAVKLFFSHLQVESFPEAQQPDFINNAVEICDLVEGFPLAIDLASCQTRWIPIAEIRKDLQASIDILNSQSINLPERHRSIQASFENVWKRLSAQEQLLIFRLTIFENPFRVQAAQAVCDVDESILLDFSKRSLLIWDGLQHYRFHRVVKQNVLERYKLSEGEQEKLAERHALWFHNQSTDLFKDCKGDRFIHFYKGIEGALSDIVAGALWFCQTWNWKLLNDLITTLDKYFDNLSLFREGANTFQKLLQTISEDEQNLIYRARLICRIALFRLQIQQYENISENINFGLETARKFNLQAEEVYCLNAISTYAYKCKNSSTAIDYANQAFELSRKINNKDEEAHSLYNLGCAQVNMGDISQAEDNLNASRVLCEQLEDWRRLSKVLNVLADIACYRGDYNLALKHYQQALVIVRSNQNLYSESLILNNVGTAYLEMKNYSKADEYFSKSVDICRQISDREGESIALSNLGETAAYQSDYESAIYYNEQALVIAEEIESDWSILAARIVLAQAYRECGDPTAAKNELIRLLKRSFELEAMNFFHRGVVEACRLLMHVGKEQDLAPILEVTMTAEGAEESTRQKAKATRDQLKEKTAAKQLLDTRSIFTVLTERLNQIS